MLCALVGYEADMYRTLKEYLTEKYGCTVKKICIDAGFSCPNRDGRVGQGGCIYCGERGAGEHLDPRASITEQVELGLARGGADAYIAYFQSFTNTYADVTTLKKRYDAALVDDRIRVLAIGTRPDCLGDEVCRLIASYKDRVDVWVELGLQTANDKTAEIINRGYPLSIYREATARLNSYGIPHITHIIIGLPGESEADALATVDEVNASGAMGVKIHSIYVMEGTRLAEMYRENLYTPPTLEEYTDLAAKALARLSPDIVVHRITGDAPKDLLVAPEWNSDKSRVIREVREKYERIIKMSLND